MWRQSRGAEKSASTTTRIKVFAPVMLKRRGRRARMGGRRQTRDATSTAALPATHVVPKAGHAGTMGMENLQGKGGNRVNKLKQRRRGEIEAE